MKIFCVIPAYNEERNIKKVLENVIKYVDEAVVVDDRSQDNTSREVRKAQIDHKCSKDLHQKKITLIRHPINRGQGAALQTGNSYSLARGADIIVHFDADGQFLAEEIPDLIKPIMEEKVDACFGSRFLGKRSNLPLLKEKLILPMGKIVNRLFFKIKTTDPQNGFRALSRQATLKIKIEQDKMAHCSEILHKAHKEKLRIKEVPITVIYHEYGQNFSGGVRIIKDIIIKRLI
ncbi:MAG: glycosyltransferase family 2 protein, partial [Patescibacteria group bacterium]